jgi:hypothetical protein
MRLLRQGDRKAPGLPGSSTGVTYARHKGTVAFSQPRERFLT